MWRMHSGDRILTDAEWVLFCVGLDLLVDFVREDLDGQGDLTVTGATAFDRLTAEQKFVILADVATALRDPAVPTPHHTAANEAAIAAVLYTVQDALAEELDRAADPETRSRRVRQLLLDVAVQAGWDDLPRVKSKSRGRWQDVLDAFESQILWDDDHLLGDAFLDLPPAEARRQMDLAGISDEYYLDTPDEPDEAGLIRARQRLARLCGRTAPGDDGLYPGLIDYFTDLNVGPLSPDQAAAWEDHPWVAIIGQSDNAWDCPFAEWAERHSGRLPVEPFETTPALPGVAYALPGGVTVEPLSGQWVIRDGDGSFWVDALGNGWASADVLDDDTPPLAFPTAADAKAAYLQADRLYAERAARHRAAMSE